MNSQTTPVKTRFAPSPTGFLHIGSVRTALFSWLYAKHHGGEFVLRIEDTDSERSSKEMTEQIISSLRWLGIEHDGEIIYQSERTARYKEVAEKLLDEGKAYHCYCTKEELDALRAEQLANKQKPRYDGRCRERTTPRAGVDPVVRFRTPDEGEITFEDRVYQNITTANAELDDLVILRSDGMPTYNFCVVVDDMDMGITHVIRGDDHLNNTPRQIHIWSALQGQAPQFAHVPMILDEHGKKLSKRTGAAGVNHYQELGYLPQALKNYLLRLGWSHGDQEIFSAEEMIELFDFNAISRSPAALNLEKLDWLNAHYLNEMPLADLSKELAHHIDALGWDLTGGPELSEVLPMLLERYKTLTAMAKGAEFLYCKELAWDTAKQAEHLSTSHDLLQDVVVRLEHLDTWEEGAIKESLDTLLKERGIKMKELGGVLRYVLTAGAASPGLALTLQWLGQQTSIQRIQQFMDQA